MAVKGLVINKASNMLSSPLAVIRENTLVRHHRTRCTLVRVRKFRLPLIHRQSTSAKNPADLCLQSSLHISGLYTKYHIIIFTS